MIELFTHGSVSVVRDVLTALGSLPGFAPAQPGEFTQRALRNGKMNLTEVEGTHDLIVAETSLQRQLAIRALQGETGRIYTDWSTTITRCLAHLEALIDFGEDEMLDPHHMHHITDQIRTLRNSIETHLAQSYKGELIRDGVRIVLVGRPNAGKSSLLNRLTQRDIAIVSPIKGCCSTVITLK
jgi:tRNA modification GTPase